MKSTGSRISIKLAIALAILGIGVIVGVIAAASPVGSFSQQHAGFISPFSVDPNDFKTEALAMSRGETVAFMVQLDNQTVFRLYLMNSTDLAFYEKCAPKCMQPLLGGSGPYYRQYGLPEPPLYLNVTVVESTPRSESFKAPASGTYYFVFDNSEGPNWSSYLNQNATGFTSGTLTISTFDVVSTYVANWRVGAIALAEIVLGGALATALWESKIRKARPGRFARFARKFGTVLAAVVIIVVLIFDSPIFLNAYNANAPGHLSTTTSVTATTSVSNYSFFPFDEDYISNPGQGGFGASALDAQDQFMYTPAMANNSIYVYDLPDEAPTNIGGFNGPQSVLYIPETYYQGVLVVSNVGNNTVDILSDNTTLGIFGLTLTKTGEVALPDPGALAYDSSSGIIYVAYGNGSQSGIGVINENTGTELGSITLPATPGQLAVEQNGTRIFVNIPSVGEVDVIDKTTRQVVATWPVGSAKGNTGMALDETDGRLFIGSSNPSSLTVLDDNSGEVIATFSLPSAPGGILFDQPSGLVIAACTGGTLVGYQMQNPNSYVFSSSQETSPGATSAVDDPGQEYVFVAAPQADGQSAQVFTFAIYST